MNSHAHALIQEDVHAVLAGRVEQLRGLAGRHLFLSGGTGLLGKWILETVAALNDSHGFAARVTVLSRNAAAFQARFPHLGGRAEFRFTEGDVRSFGGFPPDTEYVIHAAALTDRRAIAASPTQVGEVNALGTSRLLRAATLLDDLRSFVLLGSGLSAGGHPFDLPAVGEAQRGRTGLLEAGAIYAESKRFAEALAHSYASEARLPICVLRPFGVVGPYQPVDLPWAVTDFVREALNGGPLRIMGDGTTVRSLLYASDFAFWTLRALVHAKPRSVYNVGSDVPVDLLSLARLVASHFTPEPRILTNQGQGHDPSRLVPSIDRIRDDLGVAVTVPLEEAVRKTIRWNSLLSARNLS